MSIGQLYYYNKCLDKINLPISGQNLLNVELAGLKKEDLIKLQGLDSDSILTNLLSSFGTSYLEYLNTNSLFTAKNIWLELISPTKTVVELNPKSEYQKQVSNWLSGDGNYLQLYDLIKTGHILTEYEDFALFYGLKTIYVLTSNSIVADNKLAILSDTTVLDVLDNQPKILAIISAIYQPLFQNINCLFIAKEQNQEAILNQIKQILNSQTQIELILIENNEFLCKFLQKNLINSSLLITSIDLSNSHSKSSFFEDLVRKTLGIRLTI